MNSDNKTKNPNADSAGMGGAVSATEATGLYTTPRTRQQEEAADEIFPLEVPRRGEYFFPEPMWDTEFGDIEVSEPTPGFFSMKGKLDPADDFTAFREPEKQE